MLWCPWVLRLLSNDTNSSWRGLANFLFEGTKLPWCPTYLALHVLQLRYGAVLRLVVVPFAASKIFSTCKAGERALALGKGCCGSIIGGPPTDRLRVSGVVGDGGTT